MPFSRGPSAAHVVLSDALARAGRTPSLWWHAADRSTLLLGAGQSGLLHHLTTPDVARRHSGGTAVLATPHVLGLDVLLPSGHLLAVPDVVEAYRWLGLAWAATLKRLGLDARVVSVDEARAAPAPPTQVAQAVRLACFGTLSPYEVVVANRKIVGLAQVRRRNVLLQSGLHFRFDAAVLARLLAPDQAHALTGELLRRATGLAELGLGSILVEDVAETFGAVLAERHHVVLTPGNWTQEELRHAGLEA